MSRRKCKSDSCIPYAVPTRVVSKDGVALIWYCSVCRNMTQWREAAE